MRQNETFHIRVTRRMYADLAYRLRKQGDQREPDEIVALALKEWLERHLGHNEEFGYQWKELLLPNGTKLRLRHHGTFHYAEVAGDQVIYQGKSVTPRGWTLLVTGTVHNAWRDIWIKRNDTELWTQASAWRAQEAAHPKRPGIDRRRRGRRQCD